MALPKINSTPEYEVVIPSTNKTIRYRPFLIKEQKVLLIALESKDEKQVLSAINNTIKSCVKDNINLSTLTTYDTEYIFTQIRSKSVGEKAKITMQCTSCTTANEVEIDFERIKISGSSPAERTIKLNDDYSIKMRHPSYLDVGGHALINATSQTEKLIESIIICLDSLIGEEDIVKFKDEPRKEVEEFIDNLNSQQMDSLIDFIRNIPTLTYDVDYKCKSCGHENHSTLRGLGDFF